jgi:hypothetical protein
MILSHRHRFIFVKGIKVAGTSVEIALSRICGPDDIITPITPIDERLRLATSGEPKNYSNDVAGERDFLDKAYRLAPSELRGLKPPKGQFYNHMPLREVLELVPEARDYRLLFVERSPYAKTISYANWDANYADYMVGQPLPGPSQSIEQLVQRTIDDSSILKVRNLDRYLDPDGSLRTCGWRFETLAEDLSGFMRECRENSQLLPHAKRGFGSESMDVGSALRPSQLAYIDAAFADEFETFGYPRYSPERRRV